MPLLLPLVVPLLLQLPQHQVILASGPRADLLDVVAVDEANPSASPAPVLTGIELVSLEHSARTTFAQMRFDRARRVPTAGVAALALPDGGFVYKYRRAARTVWGFLLVTGSGRAVPLVERAGTGTAGVNDPFRPKIGIAPDGAFALIGTATELLLTRLDGNSWASSAAAVRALFATPTATIDDSYMIGRGWCLFTDGSHALYRCATADNATPALVQLPGGSDVEEELVMSEDGTTAGFLAGPSRDQLTIYVVQASSAPVPVAPPGHYEEPGYLPAAARGPIMALSPDGSQLAYTDSGNREEMFLVPTGNPAQVQQVTADEIFNPYIDTGVFFVFVGPVLAIGFGDDPNAVDVYSVRSNNTQLQVRNITQTSGFTAPPYGGIPTLDIQSVQAGPNGDLLVTVLEPGGLALLRIDAVNGTHSRLASGLLEEPAALPAGPGGFPDLLTRTATDSTLWMDLGSGYLPTASLPAPMTFTRSALQPHSGWRFVSIAAPTMWEATFLLQLPTRAFLLAAGAPLSHLGWTPSGGALLCSPGPGTLTDHISSSGAVSRVPVQGAVVRVLSGQ